MSKLKEIIAKGKSQGYIENLELKTYLPTDITDEEQIEDIIAMVRDMGIEVRVSKAEIINIFNKK